jgi:hypothetical protein
MQDGCYHNIFELPERFYVKGDLSYKYVKRPLITSLGLHVDGTLSFKECKSEIILSDGLSARHITISKSPKLRRLGNDMTCSVLEIDFIPPTIPDNMRIDTVVYETGEAKGVQHRLTRAEFIKLVTGNLPLRPGGAAPTLTL